MSLIQADNTWLLWAVVVSMAAFSIFAEQKWKWAGMLSAAIIAIFGSMILVNIHLVPAKADVYSVITGYILPLSIPMLLFKCDLKKIIKESGKMFLIVNVAALGTMIMSLICGLVLKNLSPDSRHYSDASRRLCRWNCEHGCHGQSIQHGPLLH